MKQHDLARPIGHAGDCRCRACLNITWLNANGAENRPIPIGRVHPANCQCPQHRPNGSMLARFRAAAAPGDLAAISLGCLIGVAIAVLLVVVNNFDAIATFMKGFW